MTQELKGYGGGKITIDGDNVFIKQLFIKEQCTLADILAVDFTEPTLMKNGSLQITTRNQIHQIFFLSGSREDSFFKSNSPNLKIKAVFTPTKVIGDFMAIDDENKLIEFKTKIVKLTKSYEDVLDFELVEDETSVIKGGIGKAVAGGILFGGVGAIVGGSTGKKKSSSMVQKLELIVRINDLSAPTIQIPLINTPTKRKSMTYSLMYKLAQDAISVLNIVTNSNSTQEKEDDSTKALSVPDELRKFKSLLDDGIITQEEFDAKKKQLLGL